MLTTMCQSLFYGEEGENNHKNPEGKHRPETRLDFFISNLLMCSESSIHSLLIGFHLELVLSFAIFNMENILSLRRKLPHIF